MLKLIPVFRTVDCRAVGSDDLNAARGKGICQIDCSLAAEGCDDAFGLFELDDVHDVLGAQRLEIKLVRAGVIRRYGFGVIVDDDGLVASGTNRLYGMHGRVIELYALTDSNRTGAEHDDFLTPGDERLIFLLIGGVKIRHVACKLGSTRINHLVDRKDAGFLSQFRYRKLGFTPELSNRSVGKSHAFRFP